MHDRHPDPAHRSTVPRSDPDLVGELRALLADGAEVDRLAEHLTLLADPLRLRLLLCLHAHPGIRSSDLARATDAHESTASHALAQLRRAGWVRTERTGREVRYVLADPAVHELLHALGSAHLPGVEHHAPDAPGSSGS